MRRKIFISLIFGISMLFCLSYLSYAYYHLSKRFNAIENKNVGEYDDISSLIRTGVKVNSLSTQNIIRIADVPLTPFVAPLKVLDPPITDLPKFLLYKTDYLSVIGDQGNCGSCWAFTIASLLGDHISINTTGKIITQLSVQQILSCFEPETGCDGNSPEQLLLWLETTQYKLKSESRIKYAQFNDNVITSKCPYSDDGITVKKGSVKSITKFIEEKNPDKKILMDNINRIKYELFMNGPVYCAMTIYDDFFEYTGLNIYKHSPDASKYGGHAVEIIGYCDKNVDNRKGIEGGAYWICRNSWGDGWPILAKEYGYFAIQMGTNECGVESRSGTAMPNIEIKDKINLSIMRYESFSSFMRYNRIGMFS